ncbi:MAG: 50S ribosomal protein L35ae [Nanoarchaeota archaeon]
MEAIIINFRIGGNRQYNNQLILQVPGLHNKEKAKLLIGKKVIWKSPKGKELTGVIKNIHGNKGALRAYFNTGMPGQCLGTKVEIV